MLHKLYERVSTFLSKVARKTKIFGFVLMVSPISIGSVRVWGFEQQRQTLAKLGKKEFIGRVWGRPWSHREGWRIRVTKCVVGTKRRLKN